MSTKKLVFVVVVLLVASAVMLAVVSGAARALSPAQKRDSPGEAGLTAQGLNAAAGGPIGSNFNISNLSDTEAVSPTIAYNPDREEYLVVWYNDRPGNDDIYAQRVSKTGKLVGNWFVIAAGTGHERRHPDVAYNSQQKEYLVVWEDDGCAIAAQRVSGEGQLQGGEITIASCSPPSGNNRPAVAYGYDQYVVVWVQDFWGNKWHIQGVTVSSTGSLGSYFFVSEDPGGEPRGQPDVAYNRSRNEYLVVWQQYYSVHYDIYARRVQGNGTPMFPASIAIDTSIGDQLNPAVAAIPTEPDTGYYLVVWGDYALFGDANIYARRVKGEGTTDGNSFLVSGAAENESHPAVVGYENTQEYLVVWTHEDYSLPFLFDGIFGRAVSINGDLLGGETVVGGLFADNAAVASGPVGDFLVAFDDLPLTADRDIYGRLWGNRVYLPLMLCNF